MRKWGIALAAVGLLAAGVRAGDLKYVPVDTSRNLVAPPAGYGQVVQKKSFFGRIGDSVKSLSPFGSKKTVATAPAPVMPVTSAVAGAIGRAASVATSPTKGFSASAR